MKNKILAALLTGTLIGASMLPYHAFAADYDNSQTTEKKYASGTEFEQDDIVYILYKTDEPRLRVKEWKADKREAVVPETVEGIIVDSIGNSAFIKKENLIRVELPSTIREINDHAFEDCSNLRTVNFPACLEKLDSASFNGCTALRDVKLNRCLTSIGLCAFQSCSKVNSLTIPGYVETLSSHVCQMMTGLYTLRLCNGVKKVVGEAALNDYDQKRIIIPPSVEELEPYSLGYRFHSGNYDGITNTKIFGAKNTEAERYAHANKIPFVEFDFKYGDMDNDGKVTSVDASMVLQEYVSRSSGKHEKGFTEAQELKADINDDFVIDSADASAIMAYYVYLSSGGDYTPEEYFFCS